MLEMVGALDRNFDPWIQKATRSFTIRHDRGFYTLCLYLEEASMG